MTKTPSEVETTGTQQREAWSLRTLPPVEQLSSTLWSIPVPMPHSPLRYVLVYALSSETHLTLIDAGWDSDESWGALNDGLTAIGASIRDVRGCPVTHQHADHIGLASRIKQASDAWIALHPAERDAIMAPTFREPSLAHASDLRWLQQLGASAEEATGLIARLSAQDRRSTYPVPDRLIEDGEAIGVPGWSLRAIHTPGHTRGHLCFFDEATQMLFGGDHVLPRVSPNISADRNPQVDALGEFLDSLDKVAGLDVDQVLPAHEWRYRGLRERTRALHDHHARRLSEVLGVVRASPYSVPWDIASKLSWSRPWNECTGGVRVSAVTETAAHVVYLQRRGLLQATDEAAPRYSSID